MSPLTRRALTRGAIAFACLITASASTTQVLAWGSTGHRIIGELGVATLPDELPAFLKTPEAIAAIGEAAREPDRWRGSGKVHDSDRDAAHFLDADDAGTVLGGPLLSALPPTRTDYDTAMRAINTTGQHAGYLPYAIVDGWQQLVKDFGYWRMETAAIPRETNPAHKAWMAADLRRRQELIIRDLGVWAHYVGDASQPMHVSIHYNGWGPFPNPNAYTQDRVHSPFEGVYVRQNLTEVGVRAAMPAPQACTDPIETCTARYLIVTQATVEPYFILQKAGGFAPGDKRGVAYATERVAAGAAALRDMVISAWAASAHASVGYPAITVDQVVSGGLDPYEALFGDD
jgi:hypothetical protein